MNAKDYFSNCWYSRTSSSLTTKITAVSDKGPVSAVCSASALNETQHQPAINSVLWMLHGRGKPEGQNNGAQGAFLQGDYSTLAPVSGNHIPSSILVIFDHITTVLSLFQLPWWCRLGHHHCLSFAAWWAGL